MKKALLGWTLGLISASGAFAGETSLTCPDPPSSEKARRNLAGEWFVKAQGLADDERYDDAVAAFECSIRMVEHPDTVFNTARAARLAGDNLTAVRYAKRYLEMRPDGEVAREAARMIEALGETPGEEKPETAAAEPVPPPETSAPSAPETGDATARPGPEEIPREATPAIDESASPDALTGATKPGKERRSKLSIAGYTALAVGGAGVVVGAVMQGLASNAWAKGNDTSSYADFKEYQDKMESCQVGALVGLIAGGIVAGSGVVMLLVGRGNDDDPVAVGLGPGSIAVSGRF